MITKGHTQIYNGRHGFQKNLASCYNLNDDFMTCLDSSQEKYGEGLQLKS